MGTSGTAGDERGPTCSRAQCGGAAAWNINWRNPRIHGIDRVKVWLACDEHRDFLRDYLDTRGFPVVVTELGTVVSSVGAP
ncbi:MAG: hypothetical protein H7146_07035 [Burkholderiaceae bacterium]|nr:hypothetical protein [Microbacteriaceae bacterium]